MQNIGGQPVQIAASSRQSGLLVANSNYANVWQREVRREPLLVVHGDLKQLSRRQRLRFQHLVSSKSTRTAHRDVNKQRICIEMGKIKKNHLVKNAAQMTIISDLQMAHFRPRARRMQ